MFSIKIRINGYLKNLNENTTEPIDVVGIKSNQNIHYTLNNTEYKITIQKDKMVLIRENANFNHKFIFELNKETKSSYYIKEYNTTIDIQILTNKLNIAEDKIEVAYKIIDSKEEYKYFLEMREKYEYKKAITNNNKRELNQESYRI